MQKMMKEASQNKDDCATAPDPSILAWVKEQPEKELETLQQIATILLQENLERWNAPVPRGKSVIEKRERVRKSFRITVLGENFAAIDIEGVKKCVLVAVLYEQAAKLAGYNPTGRKSQGNALELIWSTFSDILVWIVATRRSKECGLRVAPRIFAPS